MSNAPGGPTKHHEKVRLERFDGTEPSGYKRWRRKAELICQRCPQILRRQGGVQSCVSTSAERLKSSLSIFQRLTFAQMMGTRRFFWP